MGYETFCAQLSMKFILLKNVKIPTIVGILTFISSIYTSESFNARQIIILHYFSFLLFHDFMLLYFNCLPDVL